MWPASYGSRTYLVIIILTVVDFTIHAFPDSLNFNISEYAAACIRVLANSAGEFDQEIRPSVVGLRTDVRVSFASPVLRLPAVRPGLRIAGSSTRIEVGPDATNGAYSLTIVFGVTSLPSRRTAAFNPPLLQPPVGGAASSTLTVTTSTPIGSYPLNVTATDSSEPRWVQLKE
jgi:hypothetical protein